MTKKLSIFVLSCDRYSDLWQNFFKLREKYWSDCDFDWYLVTESFGFNYNNVKVINTGKGKNWTGRLLYAVKQIDTPYIGWYLDDFYISKKIDNQLIHELVDKMAKEHISHINMSDVFDSIIKMPEPHIYYDKYLLQIPTHKKYGISTASALWEKEYLLNILGESDKDAWQFEVDLCKKALSKDGLPGVILCDERKPFNVTTTPVVIQGRYYPKAIKEFAKKGIIIDYRSRGLMKRKDVFLYDLNTYLRTLLRSYPNLSKNIKWIVNKVLRIKFYT